MTVALDVDPESARPFIEAARPEHPSLIDRSHVLDQLFGVVNVPSGVWVDEEGFIVRPAEPAFPGRMSFGDQLRDLDVSTLPADIAELIIEARKIRRDPEGYLEMVRDWVQQGPTSPYAHAPDEVARRTRTRSGDEGLAAAHFELGQYLREAGDEEAAIRHWRECHRLQPDNWTYKRQAWELVSPGLQGHTGVYEGSWVEDVRKIGAENYYPPVLP